MGRRSSFRLLACLLLAACVAGLAPPPPPSSPRPSAPAEAPSLPTSVVEAISARLDAAVEAQGLVGISLAVVEGGRVAHTMHRGWEDREARVPASDATMYRWASISKPLTAIAAMQLVEQGKLDLDADIRDLVPEFPDKGKKITARHLLCHQGGIVHYANGPVIPMPRPDLRGRYADVIDALDRFKLSPLVGEPGEKYSYSTHGYILLGAVVQRAGGQPFRRQVAERIAAPLGMTSLRPDYQWEKIPHRAVGYRPRNGEMARSSDTDVSWKLPGGGFISNVGDLARLAAGLMNGGLVEPETREQMFTPQRTAAGEATTYGLGFAIAEHAGHRLILHSGSQEKARTMLMMIPDRGVAVAIMCNTESARLGDLGRDVLTIMLEAATVPAE